MLVVKPLVFESQIHANGYMDFFKQQIWIADIGAALTAPSPMHVTFFIFSVTDSALYL